MINKGLFSSASQHWATPKELYAELDKEFHFNDDPCPLHGEGGLLRDWGSVTYVNPPYGKVIGRWLLHAYCQSRHGKTIVCLIPSRTDTRWWHDIVMKADEIRFLRGRLKFGNSNNSAPFPSAVVVFRGDSLRGSPQLLNSDQIDGVGFDWLAEYKEELMCYLYKQREVDIEYYQGVMK